MKNKKAITDVSVKILYVALLVASYIIQFLFLPRLGICFPVLLLIPMTTAIAMHQREFSALLFGLLSGALWDLASSLPDGTLALLFAVAACGIGLLIRYVLRNTLLTALSLNLILIIFFSGVSYMALTEGFDYEFFKDLLFTHYLPSIVISLIFTIPDYLLIRAISKFTQTDKF